MVVLFWCNKIDQSITEYLTFHVFLNRNYFLIMSLYKSSSFCLFSISGLIENKQMLLVYIKEICYFDQINHFYAGREKTAIAASNKQTTRKGHFPHCLTKNPLYTSR